MREDWEAQRSPVGFCRKNSGGGTLYSLPDARYWLGRIEHWTGEGTVFPFSIARLDRAQLEKPGSVMEAFVVE